MELLRTFSPPLSRQNGSRTSFGKFENYCLISVGLSKKSKLKPKWIKNRLKSIHVKLNRLKIEKLKTQTEGSFPVLCLKLN